MRNVSARIPASNVLLVQTAMSPKDRLHSRKELVCLLEHTLECAGTRIAWSPSERRVMAQFLRWHKRVTGSQPGTGVCLDSFLYWNFNSGYGLVLIPTDGWGEIHSCIGAADLSLRRFR